MSERLTKEQLWMLVEACFEPLPVTSLNASDVSKLERLGLVLKHSRGVGFDNKADITPAGRAHIRKACEVSGD